MTKCLFENLADKPVVLRIEPWGRTVAVVAKGRVQFDHDEPAAIGFANGADGMPLVSILSNRIEVSGAGGSFVIASPEGTPGFDLVRQLLPGRSRLCVDNLGDESCYVTVEPWAQYEALPPRSRATFEYEGERELELCLENDGGLFVGIMDYLDRMAIDGKTIIEFL